MDPINEFNLISVSEIAELFGVSRVWAHQLTQTGDFPAPVYEKKNTIKLWRLADVKVWGTSYNYLEVY